MAISNAATTKRKNQTGTQSFITTLSYSLGQKLWVLLLNFDWLVSKSSVNTFQPTRRHNFVCHHSMHFVSHLNNLTY